MQLAEIRALAPEGTPDTLPDVMGMEPPNQSAEAEGLPEDRLVPRPEDYIGRRIGTDHQVESIEAIGSKFVVFKLRNLKTGMTDQVMKVPRTEFDPQAALWQALPEALRGMRGNPDRVVRICDRLLAIEPKSEAAAFNKGVALLAGKQPAAALEAFNLAVTLQPKDLLNLIHRAACLAMLQRDDESLRDFQTAADLDTGQLKTLLTKVPRLAGAIRQAIARLAKTAANREDARNVLRAHFSPGTRLRLLFHRFYS